MPPKSKKRKVLSGDGRDRRREERYLKVADRLPDDEKRMVQSLTSLCRPDGDCDEETYSELVKRVLHYCNGAGSIARSYSSRCVGETIRQLERMVRRGNVFKAGERGYGQQWLIERGVLPSSPVVARGVIYVKCEPWGTDLTVANLMYNPHDMTTPAYFILVKYDTKDKKKDEKNEGPVFQELVQKNVRYQFPTPSNPASIEDLVDTFAPYCKGLLPMPSNSQTPFRMSPHLLLMFFRILAGDVPLDIDVHRLPSKNEVVIGI